MDILKNVIPSKDYNNYPWKNLFERIGMTSVTWEQDGAGTYVGSSYMFSTPRDLAKFGQLMLKKGNWYGEQIVPKEWIKYSTTLAPVFSTSFGPEPCDKRTYGAHFWLNVPAPKMNLKKPYSAAPDDMFAAMGHGGQAIFVIPSLELVVVRTAQDGEGKKEKIDKNKFLELLLQSLPTKVVSAKEAK